MKVKELERVAVREIKTNVAGSWKDTWMLSSLHALSGLTSNKEEDGERPLFPEPPKAAHFTLIAWNQDWTEIEQWGVLTW